MLGCFSSSALLRAQHTSSESVCQPSPTLSLFSTTLKSGSVCAPYCVSLPTAQRRTSPPFHCTWGGLGLRSASRTSHAAYWSSWADCLSTIRERHGNIAQTMVDALSSPDPSAVHLAGAVASRSVLASVGFECPSLQDLLEGLRPRQPTIDEWDPGTLAHSWQFFAGLTVESQFRDVALCPHVSPTQRALLRSQSGPMSGLPFSTVPSSFSSRFPSQLFRVLLLRRLWLPLPLSSRTCRCGHALSRLFWPPPRSVFEVWGPRQSRLLHGKCRCPGLSRSRRQGVHERLRPGPGHLCRLPRRQALGGRGRRTSFVWRRATCDRYNAGVSHQRRWTSSPPLRCPRWCRAGAGAQAKATHLP